MNDAHSQEEGEEGEEGEEEEEEEEEYEEVLDASGSLLIYRTMTMTMKSMTKGKMRSKLYPISLYIEGSV